jgi:nucleotide-binding universal stress UspA family protein
MKTIKRILCSTDLTPDSDEALRCALALAGAFRAQVLVCHAVESETLTEELQAGLRRELSAALSRAGQLPQWEAIIEAGEASEVITRIAAEHHADLIVMRSRHRSYAASLLGSTAEAVCHQAPCPVLVTHPREREWVSQNSNDIRLQRILMAHDFSTDSEAALMFALSLAREFGAALHLLHVLPAPVAPVMADGADTTLLAADNQYETVSELEESVPEEARQWCEIRYAVRTGIPWREVLAYADEQEMDLICMGFRGAGFARGELAGSNADQVLRESSCPVLIARPPKPASFVLAESRAEAFPPELQL